MVVGNDALCLNAGMNESFGMRLKRIRKDARLSQFKLAELCGWKQSRIGNYEVDKREPSLVDISKMALALSVPDSDLLLGGEPGTYPLETTTGKLIADILDDHCQNLPESVRSQIIGLANGVGQVFVGVSAEPSGKPRDDGLMIIPYYDSFGEDNHGLLPSGYVRTVHSLVVEHSTLPGLGIHFGESSELEILSAWSSDMEGTIGLHDQVIVDLGVKAFNGDGVYLITWLGQLYLRRIERVGNDQYELIPDNPKHTRRVVEATDVCIHARVAGTLKATKV